MLLTPIGSFQSTTFIQPPPCLPTPPPSTTTTITAWPSCSGVRLLCRHRQYGIKFCPKLVHMTSSGNRAPDLLIYRSNALPTRPHALCLSLCTPYHVHLPPITVRSPVSCCYLGQHIMSLVSHMSHFLHHISLIMCLSHPIYIVCVYILLRNPHPPSTKQHTRMYPLLPLIGLIMLPGVARNIFHVYHTFRASCVSNVMRIYPMSFVFASQEVHVISVYPISPLIGLIISWCCQLIATNITHTIKGAPKWAHNSLSVGNIALRGSFVHNRVVNGM